MTDYMKSEQGKFCMASVDYLTKIKEGLLEVNEENKSHFSNSKKAIARSVEHGIFMGLHNEPDFVKQFIAYRVMKDSSEAKEFTKATGEEYIEIEFYQNMDYSAPEWTEEDDEEFGEMLQESITSLNKSVMEQKN